MGESDFNLLNFNPDLTLKQYLSTNKKVKPILFRYFIGNEFKNTHVFWSIINKMPSAG